LIKTAQPNIPRFEFDTDGNCLGLLIEESRTNLVTYSEDFNNVVWIKNVNLSSVPDSPNNTNSYLAIPTGSNTTYYLNYNTTINNSASSLSIYAKAGGYDKLLLWSNQGGGYGFNLSTGQTFSVGNITDSLGASIESVGNGWYRCSITVSSFSRFNPYILNSETYETWTPDGTSGIYLWGAQLEAGSFATSYIPTSGSTVTRAADFAKITGTNFTDFYGDTDHSFFVDFDLKNTTSTDSMAILTLPSATYPWLLYRYIDDYWKSYNGSDSIVNVSSTYSQTNNKFAFAIGSSNGSSAYNGSLTQTNQTALKTGLYSNASSILLFTRGSDFIPSGYLKQLKYYPKRLTNAQLQSLTRQ